MRTADSALRPLSRAKRRLFAALAARAGRERHGLFLLEGPRAIEDALARGAALKWVVAAPEGRAWLERWLEEGRLPDETARLSTSANDLAEMADTETPQGVIAIGAIPSLRLDERPAPAARVSLLADGLQDPGNLGTLFRTLVATGGELAICPRGCVDPWNPKALRAAAGATFALDVVHGVETAAGLAWCRTRNVRVVALEAGAPELRPARLPPGPLAVAVGNEAAGLSELVREAADVVAGLPMASGVESLSAPVAGSIALYLLARDARRDAE